MPPTSGAPLKELARGDREETAVVVDVVVTAAASLQHRAMRNVPANVNVNGVS